MPHDRAGDDCSPIANAFGMISRVGFCAPLLRGRSVVVLQQAAQTLTTRDAVVALRLNALGEKQDVAQALMGPFEVIMRDELASRPS
jgi:hypothetical protein